MMRLFFLSFLYFIHLFIRSSIQCHFVCVCAHQTFHPSFLPAYLAFQFLLLPLSVVFIYLKIMAKCLLLSPTRFKINTQNTYTFIFPLIGNLLTHFYYYVYILLIAIIISRLSHRKIKR